MAEELNKNGEVESVDSRESARPLEMLDFVKIASVSRSMRVAILLLGLLGFSAGAGARSHSSHARIKAEKVEGGVSKKGLEDKYGIKIKRGNCPFATYYTGEIPDEDVVKQGLIDLSRVLAQYPSTVTSRLKGVSIYLARNVKLKNFQDTTQDKEVGGYSDRDYIVINLDSGVPHAFHHEFFHIMDDSDGGDDNAKWAKATSTEVKGGVPRHGHSSVLRGEVCSDVSLRGFANCHGKKGGAEEDQATIGEGLMDPSVDGNLYVRAMSDPALQNRLEMETGLFFDSATGRFKSPMTLDEYKAKFGFEDWQYYAKWSRGRDGKPKMGVKYWNDIARGTKK